MRFSLKSKVLITIIIIAIIFGVSTGFISYKTYSQTVDQSYMIACTNLSRTVATGLDLKQVKLLKDQVMSIYKKLIKDNGGALPFETFSESDWDAYFRNYDSVYNSESYKNVLDYLREAGKANPGSCAYIGYTDIETGYGLYLADGTIDGEVCPIGAADKLENVTLAEIKKGNYGFPPNITNYEKYGWLCSVGEEIRSNDGELLGTLCIDISMDDIKQEHRNFLERLCAALLIISLAIILILVFLVNRIMVNPINELTNATASFVSDKKNNGSGPSQIALLSIHTNDEIEKLCMSIKKMEKDLNSYIEDLIYLTEEKERIGAELYFDIMTGAMNRRYYEEQLCNACCQCIVSIDLDYFKKINDDYGHVAGDEVLIRVVNTCKEKIRKDDIIVRMGGDEFLIAFYKIDKDTLYKKLTEIFNAISDVHLQLYPDIHISISAGCVIQKKFDSQVKVSDMYGKVDNILYKAKEAKK